MKASDLTETGLTKNQAEVYLGVLKNPGQSGGELAKRLSIDRSFAYNILNALIDKGLISHIVKEKARLFYPADPNNFFRDIEEKRSKISKIVKELKTIKEKPKIENSVSVYEGKAGLKTYILEMLNAKSFLTLGGGGKLKILEVLEYDYPHYFKKFREKKISGKLITSPQNKKVMDDMYKKMGGEIRTFNDLKSDFSFTIFKNKLAIYSAEEKPFVVMIESENISQALRSYFEKLWKTAKV
jgi:sugar-specific transcriptional regulator TrmB